MAEAARAMDGQLVAGAADTVWRGVAIDSRKAGGGALFFALPGAQVDGHAFAAAAVAAGAAGIVTTRAPEPAPEPATPSIRVGDTYRALHDLTRAVRRRVPRKLVGITGSMGKTTTKDLLATMLGLRYRTAKSPGNLNNTYGFPLALLGIADDAEWMVAEMGMSTPGELRLVSELGQPDVAIFTNVRPAHLANFGSVAAIADAKAELLAGMSADGTVVANADDPQVVRIAERHRARGGHVVRYGFDGPDLDGPDLDVWASTPRQREDAIGSQFTVHTSSETAAMVLPIHGLYNAENALAAIACAVTLGVPLAAIAGALADFATGPMRGKVRSTPYGATVIDDVYNANPAAVERALESAAELPARRRIAVLGDMLELGPDAEAFHRQIGTKAATLGFSGLVGVGPLSRATVEAAHQAGLDDASWLDDTAAAVRWAHEAQLSDDAVVLVKGSRGMALEAVVKALVSPERVREVAQ